MRNIMHHMSPPGTQLDSVMNNPLVCSTITNQQEIKEEKRNQPENKPVPH